MADQQLNAYGQAAQTNASGRRIYDREAAAAAGAAREAREKAEARARYESKVAGHHHVRALTPPDATYTSARAARLNVAHRVGTTTLVAAGNAIGKRGRGAGFYCEDCDLTFKDNLQWVDHLNSRQHLVNTGQTGDVKRATLGEVRERLAFLKRRREEQKEGEVVDLQARLKIQIETRAKEQDEKREKRREKRKAKAEDRLARVPADPDFVEVKEEDEMAEMMGFGGFRTSKK